MKRVQLRCLFTTTRRFIAVKPISQAVCMKIRDIYTKICRSPNQQSFEQKLVLTSQNRHSSSSIKPHRWAKLIPSVCWYLPSWVVTKGTGSGSAPPPSCRFPHEPGLISTSLCSHFTFTTVYWSVSASPESYIRSGELHQDQRPLLWSFLVSDYFLVSCLFGHAAIKQYQISPKLFDLLIKHWPGWTLMVDCGS